MSVIRRIRIDQVAVRSMLRSPTGPVGRKVLAKGKEIEELARKKAVRHHMEGWVHSTPLPTVLGTNVLVYCDHHAALFVLKGTKPHDIPFSKPQALNFKVGWRTVTVVHHPGYKGDDFLGKAMLEAGPL